MSACLYCGAELVRQPNEYPSAFVRRKCCNQHCAVLYTAANRKDKHHPICGVYQIKNLTTDKVYIGSSSDIRRRWQCHRDTLRKGTSRTPYLQHAWNKYGLDDFEFIILETTDIDTLLLREQHWIDTLQSANPAYGYNLLPTAGNNRGHKASAETRRKLSLVGKGRNAGSKHKLAKLTEEQVFVIKERLAQGDTIEAIAADYGVCFQSIGLIRSGKTWTHVSGPELTRNDLDELRNHNLRGTRNPAAKLAESQVAEIKTRLAAGEIGYDLARIYHVSKSLIYAIKVNKIWSHITPAKQ